MIPLFKSQSRAKTKIVGCAIVLLLLSIPISWTCVKRADKPWSAFLSGPESPERIAAEIGAMYHRVGLRSIPKEEYHFDLFLPARGGGATEFYMLKKDDRRELHVRETIAGGRAEENFISSLPSRLRRRLVNILEIELAKASPTSLNFVLDSVRVAIIVTIPVANRFNRELLAGEVNKLDSVTLILQRTFIMWAEDHGYQNPLDRP